MSDHKNIVKFKNPTTYFIRNVKKESDLFGRGIEKSNIFAPTGEMAEWSKAHAWKVCNRQKRFMGSNPILSADFFISLSYHCFLNYQRNHEC